MKAWVFYDMVKKREEDKTRQGKSSTLGICNTLLLNCYLIVTVITSYPGEIHPTIN